MIFTAGRALPGDIGRAVLGPLAAPEAVAKLNAQLGTDQPLIRQYPRWMGDLFHGWLGTSLTYGDPVAPRILAALAQSAQLALVAIAVLVPLAVGAGTYAGLHKGTLADRAILLLGISLATIPDFVMAILMIIVFCLVLGWISPSGPAADADLWQTLTHLALPAAPLVVNLFGYIARITRTGVVQTLEADFTRTARLKGLSEIGVIWKHVLPNALTPTIAVLATQVGHLLGGIVVIEALFNIEGLGALVANAARSRDYPTLQAGVLAMAVIYAVVTTTGDLAQLALDPKQRERLGA
jgi:peptide/nickel transport system permease protein